MTITTIALPIAEPVSLSDMKEFLRIDSSDTSNDITLTGMMIAAREWCEGYVGKKFVTQDLQINLDTFPPFLIELPYPPIQELLSFSYLDTNGNPITMASGSYQFDQFGMPARLTPPWEKFWPLTRWVTNAVTVQIRTGYGLPATINLTQGSVAVSGATFTPDQVGKSIFVPGATYQIASVNGGAATLATPATASVSGASAWVGTYKLPEKYKLAVKFATAAWYEDRIGDEAAIKPVKALLYGSKF